MARVNTEKTYVNFVKGLNTEANLLVSPEGSARDLDNLELNTDGSVSRRVGMDFEEGYDQKNVNLDISNYNSENIMTALAESAHSTHEWKSVNNDGGLNFIVTQIGGYLYIFDASKENPSDYLLETIFLDEFAINTALYKQQRVQTSYGKGVLIVTGNYIEPFYIEYHPDATIDFRFPTTKITIETRDLEGVEDGYAVNNRSSSMTNLHRYNLYNQGWSKGALVVTEGDGDEGTFGNTLDITYWLMRVYPANSDIMSQFKISASEEATWAGCYSPWELFKYNVSNAEAPRGHYILKEFKKDRQTASGLAGVNGDDWITNSRPASTAFYSGRVWFAGVNSDNAGGNIYYSQLVEKFTNIGKCYQAGDPTSDDMPDVVATDGGIFKLNDVGQVLKLLPLNNSLYVFASNGIWAISGSDTGSSFTGTKQSVRKVSDVGILSAESVVEGDGIVAFFAKGGIYSMQPSETTGDYAVTSLSDSLIKTFYASIPTESKANAAGAYDGTNKKFVWIYNRGEYGDYNYTRPDSILIFDALLGAFYKHTLPKSGENWYDRTPYIFGMIEKSAGGYGESEDFVVDGSYNPDYIYSGSNQVVSTSFTPQLTNTEIKYATVMFAGSEVNSPYQTFSEFNDPEFLDWQIEFNEDYPFSSYLITGADTYQDLLRNKQNPEAEFFFKRTETGYTEDESGIQYVNPSSCYLTGAWNWSQFDHTNKVTDPQQAYKLQRGYIPEDWTDPFNYGYDVLSSKLKFRGRGKSLMLRFESEERKDFKLLGWAMPMSLDKVP